MDIDSKQQFEIPNFEDLKITTITMVSKLSGEIDKRLAFYLLPITKIEVKQTRQSSRCKLPHCETPGSILSMRYGNQQRGIVKTSSTAFRNSVSLDISISKKNINTKLSCKSIHICGAKSIEDGREAVNHTIRHLKHIQKILNWIEENKELAEEAIEYLINATKGTGTIGEKTRLLTLNNSNDITIIGEPSRQITLNIKEKDNYIAYPTYIPENFNKDLVDYCMSMCDDFIYHSDLEAKYRFLLRCPKLILSDELEIEEIDTVMVNYNYNLGFNVNRINLQVLMDRHDGFVARYNKSLSPSVTIELPYIPKVQHDDTTRRKNKIPHHTFLVYRSGAVTQSGPGGEMMREAYYRFMKNIQDVFEDIKLA